MLIQCPECSREVSSSAEKCPHCGFPHPSYYTKEAAVGESKCLEGNPLCCPKCDAGPWTPSPGSARIILTRVVPRKRGAGFYVEYEYQCQKCGKRYRHDQDSHENLVS